MGAINGNITTGVINGNTPTIATRWDALFFVGIRESQFRAQWAHQ
jgi:hypothetical protein